MQQLTRLHSSLNAFPAVLQEVRVMCEFSHLVNEVVSFKFMFSVPAWVKKLCQIVSLNTLEEVQCSHSYPATGSIPKTE